MKRFAAFVLSMAMAVSSLSAMVMAEDGDTPASSTEVTEDQDEIAESEDEADLYEDGDQTPVTYTALSWNEEMGKIERKSKEVKSYRVLESSNSDVTVTDSFTVVDKDTTINGKLIFGTLHMNLIVKDNATLTCKGIKDADIKSISG